MIWRQSLQPSGSLCSRLPRGVGFLLGGLSAALVVLTLTLASLVLSSSTGGAASSEIGQHRLPRPALSLGIAPSLPTSGIAG
jgi:hypothetical protein